MSKSFTVAELAERVGGKATGDLQARIVRPADLASAAPGEISFLANAKYGKHLAATKASAVVLSAAQPCNRKDLSLIRVANPNLAFTKIVELFAPPALTLEPGVHPKAEVSKSAKLGKGIAVGPFAVIGEGAEIGENTQIHAGCFVGPGAKIGKACVLFPRVVLLDRVVLGDRVRVMSGTVIGSDGFGYELEKGRWSKVPQCGTVVVEDDVEFGANCAVDRARFGETRIGRGSKIDNLVHIAHNVRIGPDSLLIAQVGVSGSTTLGHHVVVAGQAGIAGHLTIGDGARIAGGSGVAEDLAPGAEVWGTPAMPFAEYVKAQARLAKLGDTMARLKAVERRVESLEGKPASKRRT